MKPSTVLLSLFLGGFLFSSQASGNVGYIIKDCGEKECSKKGDNWWNLDEIEIKPSGNDEFWLEKRYRESHKDRADKLLKNLNNNKWYIKVEGYTTVAKKLDCSNELTGKRGKTGYYFYCCVGSCTKK
jgi:hypothetical protein